MAAGADPRFVRRILDWAGTWFLARLGLAGAYNLGGVARVSDEHIGRVGGFVPAAFVAGHAQRAGRW